MIILFKVLVLVMLVCAVVVQIALNDFEVFASFMLYALIFEAFAIEEHVRNIRR